MQELFRPNLPVTISGAFSGLPWLAMDTDIALRLQTWRLIRLGMNQKVIAYRMGMSPSAFNRWLHREKKKAVSVAALDGLRHFLSDLKEEATRDVTAMSTEELDRLEAELAITKTERGLKAQDRKTVKKRTKGKGTVRAARR